MIESEENCPSCSLHLKKEPLENCVNIEHWKSYALYMKRERDKAADILAMHDDDRDKTDLVKWLFSYEKLTNILVQDVVVITRYLHI